MILQDTTIKKWMIIQKIQKKKLMLLKNLILWFQIFLSQIKKSHLKN